MAEDRVTDQLVAFFDKDRDDPGPVGQTLDELRNETFSPGYFDGLWQEVSRQLREHAEPAHGPCRGDGVCRGRG